MAGQRIFAAIDLSDKARQVCSQHVEAIRREFPSIRIGWVPSEKLHITLKFLGNAEPHLVEELRNHLSGIALRHENFSLRVSTTGVFPSPNRPRILWIGITEPSGMIQSIYRDIENAGLELGFKPEERSFHPHVTIGRIRQPESSRKLAEAHINAQIEPIEFEVRQLVLYESKLLPSGSVYSIIFTAKIRGAI
ncbi:MAG: RNA 2',3'-cyclic phosphodiesterase [Acidobacteriota bacterium]